MYSITPLSSTRAASSTDESAGKLNILKINFQEVYRRHLCRHGQFGINVLHLVAVYGIYFSICSLVAALVRLVIPQLTPYEQISAILVLSVPYITVLVVNVPFGIFVVTLISVVLLAAVAVVTPVIPFWMHIILILLWHRFQLWSHKRYHLRRDMSEFEARYQRGLTLFILLAVYELPILLNYLLAGRCRWAR